MSMAALPLPRRTRGGDSLFFITVAAAAASKKRKFQKLVNLHNIFILKNATLLNLMNFIV
jgi:hypothetical protein